MLSTPSPSGIQKKRFNIWVRKCLVIVILRSAPPCTCGTVYVWRAEMKWSSELQFSIFKLCCFAFILLPIYANIRVQKVEILILRLLFVLVNLKGHFHYWITGCWDMGISHCWCRACIKVNLIFPYCIQPECLFYFTPWNLCICELWLSKPTFDFFFFICLFGCFMAWAVAYILIFPASEARSN